MALEVMKRQIGKYTAVAEIDYDVFPTSPREWDNLGTLVCWHRRYNLGDEHSFSDPEDFRQTLAIAADETVAQRLEYWENQGYERLVTQLARKHPEAKRYSSVHQDGREVRSLQEMAATMTDARQTDIINKALEQHYVMLPVYLYDHSGLAMNTGGYTCPWDSGQVGWIYVSRETLRTEYGWKRLTRKRIAQIHKHLKNEVSVYSDYLGGFVYEFSASLHEGCEQCGTVAEDGCCGFIGMDDGALKDTIKDVFDDWEEQYGQAATA